ncbi:MAG: signal peptidase II [Clostridiaceae bacterium]|jgi:signal peptidase II|nr:signal peptidase II [Clostridiaceae bacterium]
MLWVLLIIFLTGIDQLSKWYFYTNRFQYDGFVVIKDFFYLTYLENRGAAFGVLQNFRWAFIILTIVAVSIMIWYFIKNNNIVFRISMAFLISGAIGNFIDRLLRGFVVDFLDFFPFGFDFPIFNFADICVNIGAFLLIYYVIFIYKEPVSDKGELNNSEVTDEQQD